VTSSRKRVSSLLGGLIGLVGLGFVVRLMLRERDAIAQLAADGNPWWFLGALLAGLAAMTGIGLTWGVIVRDLDRPLPTTETLRSYFVGQLGKYVPGGVWAVMGRGEWATRAGVRRGPAYLSTLLSIVTTYLAASSMVAVAFILGARPLGSAPLAVAVALLAPAGLLAMHPRLFAMALRLLARFRRATTASLVPPSWSQSMGYVARQLPTWLLITVATWGVARGLGVDVDFPVLMLATCTSWVAGFLFLPTPGGIGIREAVFVAVLGGEGVMAGVALGARLVFVLVDAIGAGGTSAAATRQMREREPA